MNTFDKEESMKYKIIIGVVAFLTGIALGWVLSGYGVKKTDVKWKFGDNELAINLEQDLIDVSAMLSKIFSEDFSKRGTIEWLKEKQNLYKPDDPDIINEFSKLDYNDIVSKELRELSYKRKGPWAYQLDTVFIGIPPVEYQPGIHFANVCENGKYFTKKLRIFSLDQMKSIEVTATGKYECPEQLKYPDIQLNSIDAKSLLGTENFSKYEQGIVLILSRE